VFKKVPDTHVEKKEEKLNEIRAQLKEVIGKGYRIIFVDETMFTYNTNYKNDYSSKGTNIHLPQQAFKTKALAIIAGVSMEFGFEYFVSYWKSVDTDNFMEFIQIIRDYNKDEKIAFFLDNLNVHRTKKVRSLCKELDIPLIFNLPYSPEYNPIETYFSLLKNLYKRKKLNCIAN
jgi:transposase